MATVWYNSCKLQNTNYKNSIIKMPEYNKALSVASPEIIEIDKSFFATKTITNVLLPAKHWGLATYISTILNFKLKYAKKEQQIVDQRIANWNFPIPAIYHLIFFEICFC